LALINKGVGIGSPQISKFGKILKIAAVSRLAGDNITIMAKFGKEK